ncbi:zinc finger protein RFP-like [Gymnodraco acuticeps]|uniref:Zinc finger protein RFP-like n=1 Tax=Gymnodraco acuticeps TaxID=8218 RepID=A0A6P8UCU6_GYMAC|nr:zinc finger protein RFP-like [Gymnodraco acuticeps]
MATASSLMSEEKFRCAVCLEVFTKPVTTPCGHNFCSACIYKYWDGNDICKCPLCQRTFSQRPELHVNTFVSELAAEFKTLVQIKASAADPTLPGTAAVLCDVCSEMKGNAVKSCLTCLMSFCEVHLEPHQRVATIKSHTLLDPVNNLEDRMCKVHNKITELYCRTDQACVCVLCIIIHHKTHDVVPIEEEFEVTMAKKDETIANLKKMIQSRSEKIAEIESSVDESQKEAEREKEASVQVFSDLIRSLQRNQAELVEVIEERFRATKQKADGFLTDLRMEVADLQSRSIQLEQLSQSEDHYQCVQTFQTLCSPLNKDRTNVGVHCHLSFQAVRGAVGLLKQNTDQIVEELQNEIKMKRMREHAVDLTFDPDTAHCSLIISQDGKQVEDAGTEQILPSNPKRFEVYPEVLSKEGFTAGKLYYEVQVKGQTQWIVGVVRESYERKKTISMSVEDGGWAIELHEGSYSALTSPIVKMTLKEELQKLGVFVDYDQGVVSFYDVNSKSQIHSYTGFHFTEKMYPYFYVYKNNNGTNSAPLIITPVLQTD